MSNRLRRHRDDESGFTLIELLVVILIIGVLSAIAIPSFLNQKGKAYDASAKELARTAQTTAETYATDHGEFKWGANGLTELKKYETGLASCPNTSNACLLKVEEYESGKGYKIVTEAANTGDKFEIIRTAGDEITRNCTSNKNGCSGSSSSSW
jgi:type IV pilus assembly protein PilA